MQTLHSVLKHGALFSDWDMLPKPMFEDRLARVQRAIAASGDDGWLIYGDAQRYGDVAYVSHFVPRLRSVLIYVPKSGKPDLLASIGSRDIPASKILSWFENEMRPFTRLPGEAVKFIKERGLGSAKLGLVGTRVSLPIAEWNAIAAELPNVTFTERDAEYAVLRRTKDSAEDTALRRTADAIEAALREAQTALRAGRTVREATAEIDRSLRFAAAEDIRILIAGGDRAAIALRPPDERVINDGDTVLLHLQAEIQRYWAQGSRSYVVGGKPSDAQRALIDRAEAAVAAMQAAVRGGAAASAVAAAAKAVLGEELFAVAGGYGLGSGIGLDAQEPPRIALDSTETIPDNGAISLHVAIHAGGNGAVAGKTILVRNGAAAPLGATA